MSIYGSLKNWWESLSFKTWFLKPKYIRLNLKYEPLSWKLSKLWYFSWSNPRRKSISSKIFKSQNLGQFLRFGSNFCKWAQFLFRSSFYVATWGRTQLLHWFLRGGADLAPPLTSTGRVNCHNLHFTIFMDSNRLISWPRIEKQTSDALKLAWYWGGHRCQL